MISDFSPEELREIGLAPSREASSNYPEGSGALVPDAQQPPDVQREDSVGALLASIGQTLPPLPGQTLPPLPTGTPGSGAPVDSPPECFDGLRLAIQSHSVHKVENADTEDREYVVSNLRVFQIEVVLVNERNELAQTTNVALTLTLTLTLALALTLTPTLTLTLPLTRQRRCGRLLGLRVHGGEPDGRLARDAQARRPAGGPWLPRGDARGA